MDCFVINNENETVRMKLVHRVKHQPTWTFFFSVCITWSSVDSYLSLVAQIKGEVPDAEPFQWIQVGADEPFSMSLTSGRFIIFWIVRSNFLYEKFRVLYLLVSRKSV